MTGSRAPPPSTTSWTSEDRVLFVQTFSKNWAMTGWRIGWIEAPAALGQVIENLIQYSTSGSAGLRPARRHAAIDEGEPFVAEQIARATEGRRIIAEGLKATNRVSLAAPGGRLLPVLQRRWPRAIRAPWRSSWSTRANVGLAPGTAFGPGGETGLRLCFARKSSDLVEVVARLQKALGQS